MVLRGIGSVLRAMEELSPVRSGPLPWRALLAGLLAVALTGCGGSRSQASEAEAVVHRWELAVAERHVNEACSLLDAEGKAMIRRELADYIKNRATGSSCPALIGFLHDALTTPELRDEFRAKQPTKASVKGDTAKVRASGIFWLAREDGAWRISEVPLAT